MITLALFAALAASQDLTVRNVTVIDGTGAPRRPNQTVTIERGRISEVAPARAITRTVGRVIDGSGKFLLPGFIDAHAHVAFGPVSYKTVNGLPVMSMRYDHTASREMLTTLLAFGVTGARNPSGPTREAVAMRDSVERGLIPGPRFRTAGEVIDIIAADGMVATVKSPDDMRAEVARQAAAGVDFVKLYIGLTPPMVQAGIDEARKRGVKTLTHSLFTTWTQASNAGIDGIVHVIPGSPALIPAARRAEYMASLKGTQFMAMWFKYVDLESPEIREMTEALVRNGTVLDLTLVTFDAMFRGNQQALTGNPDLRYAPSVFEKNWREDFTLTLGWTNADYTAAAAQWPNVERFVRHLFRAGVRLVVGTDVPNPWVAPGISFHREMELYERAGIPTSDILRMATIEGARAIGLENEMGSIAAGKRADLVLLDADPLVHINNTQRIATVIVNGVPHQPRDLLPERLRARD